MTRFVEPAELAARIRTLLPEEYQNNYQDREPKPMRSAGLKYAADGSVAWDKIWGSFCDLAMAGGPPHKGRLLAPGSAADVDAEPQRYEDVVEEICRGITLATDLQVGRAPDPGWTRVTCYGDTMAAWLHRAITMENVAVKRDGLALDLPAGPAFRLEKEIKNVITVIAKTSHYWLGHMPRMQKEDIAILFDSLAKDAPLIEPDYRREDYGWHGVETADVNTAIREMRELVACNVLARREDTTLFVPVGYAR
jgi:sirohydrochlorin cobaltochelatase